MSTVTTTPVCFDLFITKLNEFVDFSDNAPVRYWTKTALITEWPPGGGYKVAGERTTITIFRRDTDAVLMTLECCDFYHLNDNEQVLEVRANVVDWTGAERHAFYLMTSIPHGGSSFIAREEIAEVALDVWGLLRAAGLAKS